MIFQRSVLNNFVQKQDEVLVVLRWANYLKFKEKIDFVKSVKEEKYQEGFLRDIFEKCLGYTLDTTDPNNFNLKREEKNETDSKKADGVIVVDKKIVGVIELKDQKSKHLDTVLNQAFDYHNSHSYSRYIIISNFNELRFYIDKKTEYEKFYLFDLKYEEFKKFHLLLSFESILDEIPLKLKQRSLNFEEEISKKFYGDYAEFRAYLFENLIKNNPTIEKLTLLKLTSKLIDRIVFILFAEDRGLLRANTIKEIREEFQKQKFTSYSLYDIYKFYFEAINSGNEKLQIPRYNGGLFAKDELLDSLVIDDEMLDEKVQKLSDYDFESEVSVNILGHIFEQSLSDIEEIRATINDERFDIKQSKRKKDGIFYTPSYITKFIVQNSLGKICFEKKKELNLAEISYPKNPKRLNKSEKETLKNIYEYREFLLGLKVLDPACGSGAFLNEAFSFLENEHKFVDKYRKIYENETLGLYDIDSTILENNLFGVDINSEAVEIAKLSLWLKSAKKGRELVKLSDKIISANSLIDDIFSDISFDVVIGNPPYVRQEKIKELKPLLKSYEVFDGVADLYVYFYELGIKKLKKGGILGYICSNKFFRAKYGSKLREFILKETMIKNIVDLSGVKVFEDATVDSAVTILEKGVKGDRSKGVKVSLGGFDSVFDVKQEDLSRDGFVFLHPIEIEIKKRVERVGTPLQKWDVNIYRGILTGFNEAFIIDGKKKEELIRADSKNEEVIKPLLRGRDIKKYEINFADKWLIGTFPALKLNINDYPTIKEYLQSFGKRLEQSGEKGCRKKTSNKWFETQDQIAYYKEFEKEKIFYNEIGEGIDFCYDDKKFYCNNKLYFITSSNLNLKFATAIFNSNLYDFYFKLLFNFGGGKGKDSFKHIPLSNIPKSLKKYQDNVEYLLNMPRKKRYDNEKKIAISYLQGKEIYITEFLFAKQRGYIFGVQGHDDILVEYYKLLPYIFSNFLFDEVFQNIDNKRLIYSLFDLNGRRIFHVIDNENKLISIYIVSKDKYKRQIDRKFKKVDRWEGGHFSILSPAEPFWRHLPTLIRLYQNFQKNSITQDDFIEKVDNILNAKEKIKLYKKHFDSLNAVEKIEIKEKIEELEKSIDKDIVQIDELVYKLYQLNKEEIQIIKGK